MVYEYLIVLSQVLCTIAGPFCYVSLIKGAQWDSLTFEHRPAGQSKPQTTYFNVSYLRFRRYGSVLKYSDLGLSHWAFVYIFY